MHISTQSQPALLQVGKTIEELLEIPVIKKIILYRILPAIEEFAEIAVGELIESFLDKEGIKVTTYKPVRACSHDAFLSELTGALYCTAALHCC